MAITDSREQPTVTSGESAGTARLRLYQERSEGLKLRLCCYCYLIIFGSISFGVGATLTAALAASGHEIEVIIGVVFMIIMGVIFIVIGTVLCKLADREADAATYQTNNGPIILLGPPHVTPSAPPDPDEDHHITQQQQQQEGQQEEESSQPEVESTCSGISDPPPNYYDVMNEHLTIRQSLPRIPVTDGQSTTT